MDELVAWLRAQLDEDERVAQAADIDHLLGWVEYGTPAGDAAEEHVKRWNSERVLAEVKAKRRILDEFSWEAGETRAVLHLAQPYAGRDGWREEWRA